MKKANKFDLKSLLVILLSVTLCFSTVLAACNNNNDSSSSSSSSSTEETKYPTDTQLLKNGDFEYTTFTKKDTDFPVSGSSTGWTIGSDSIGSSSAPAGKASSGIIDTDDTRYKLLVSKEKAPEDNPHTPEYYGLINKEELYTLEKFNGGEGEDNEDKLLTSGTKILMLHNLTNNENEGTARKFTSTSVTLARNEYAELSVWIKTLDLKSDLEGKVAGKDFGAYIAVQSTVSSSAAPLILKNIDTERKDENGNHTGESNWVKYTVYLSSSDFSTSSFRLVLGLGFGSNEITTEYVEGYAFFDNAHFKTISKTEYETAVSASDIAASVNLYKDGENNTYENNGEKFVYTQERAESDPYKANGEKKDYDENTVKDYYTEVKYALSHTRANKLYFGDTYYPDDDKLVGSFEKVDESYPAIDNYVWSLGTLYSSNSFKDLEKLPAVKGDLDESRSKAIVFNFDTTATSYKYTTDTFTLGYEEYLKLSFWVKAEVADDRYTNALTATLIDLGKKTGNEEEDNWVKTTVIANENTNDYENDNYNGWRQYVIFVSNTIGTTNDEKVARQFKLEFTFGTTEEDKKSWDLTKGFAVIADFEGYMLTADDYAIADTSSYAYAKKVSLSADLPNGASDEDNDTNDSYTFSYSESEKVAMETTGKVSYVNGYQFVKANTVPVGGTGTAYGYNSDSVNGGLINSKYYEADDSSDPIKKILSDLAAFNSNKYVQPMYIKAVSSGCEPYGFIGSSATLSANTTYYISFSVYATKGAIANFYLASTDALTRYKVLDIAPKKWTLNEEKTTIDFSNEAKFEEQLGMTFTGPDSTEVKWYTVGMLITTGNESMTYRPEFWLGTRDGKSVTLNDAVYFDNFTVTTVDKDLKLAELTNKGFTDVPGSEQKYTRPNTVILYNNIIDEETDEDSSSSSGSKKLDVERKFSEDYEETVVYKHLKNADGSAEIVYADFSTIDVEHEHDVTVNDGSSDSSSSSSSSSETVNDGSSFNWALQLTSIIIAAVLIILLVVILVKNLVEKNKSKKSKSVEFYSRDSRRIAGEKAIAKKLSAKDEADSDDESDEDDEEVEEYDYDNPEINNNDKLQSNNNEEETEQSDKTDGE